MINRSNWKNVCAYLEYRRAVDQIASNSLRLEESWLRHVLEWADEKHFEQVTKIRPALPEYIVTARHEENGENLSPVYVRHIIRSARRFFEWLPKHKRGYSSITPAWLDTLKPPRMPEVTCPHRSGPKPVLGLDPIGGRNNGKTKDIFSRTDPHETA